MELRERIQRLYDERKQAFDAAQEALDAAAADGRGLEGENQEKYTRADQRVAALTAEIEALERQDELDRRFADVPGGDPVGGGGDEQASYRDVFERYVRAGRGELERDERAILEGREARTQQTLTGAAGGYAIPEDFWRKITETQALFGGVESVANVITTDTGADLPWPSNDDTSNEGELLTEGTQVGTQDVTLGVKTLSAYVYSSKLVKVSIQLLQDSFFDWESFLARKFGERLGRIHNRHFTAGTGVSQPDGVIAGATNTESAASATAIAYDDLVDLVHEVDPAYRNSAVARWMFNDLIFAELRKLRDDSGSTAGTGRPLWEPSVQAGEPSTLLGYPYVINQNMDSTMSSTKRTVAFGDFNSGYVIRRVRDAQLVRFDEKYMDYLQVGFFVFDRMDGTIDDASAYAVLVH